MIERVRTTVDIDDDVLLAAKELAAATDSTAGKVLSDLARRGLQRADRQARIRNGVPVLPSRPGGKPITMAMVNALRDDP